MNRFLAILALAILGTAFSCNGQKAPGSSAKIFGKTPTLTETVEIATITAQPADYVNKDLMVAGVITDMCRHSGCWVEIQAKDSSRIICRSLDESVHFTTDCLGRPIKLQGKLMYDPNAPGQVEKAHEGEAAHACPAPKVLVSIAGAEVDLATTTEKHQ